MSNHGHGSESEFADSIAPAVTASEYHLLTRAESAEYEAAKLRKELKAAINCIASISYCSAQCGDDAMKMRNIAMDFMKPINEAWRRSLIS